MKLNEMPQFSKLVTQIASIYSNPMNPMLVEVYWQSLQTFDFKAVENAMFSHVQNPDVGQFMPKPADIIRFLKGSNQTQAYQAWSLVLKTIHQIGSYSSVVFDDPLIHAVINDMGGWIYLCGLLEKDIPFRAQEFEKRYSGYLLQPPKSYPKKLSGKIEQENSTHGYLLEPPVLIGDQQRALGVYTEGSQHTLIASQPKEPLEKLVELLTNPLELPTKN